MNQLCISILQDLVSFETVTPNGQKAIDYCAKFLKTLGFECFALNFNGVHNLYARFGKFGKNLCFAGHIDVVPSCGTWTVNPFNLTKKNERFYGRGTNDMKGPLAACLASISELISNQSQILRKISLSIILTSDEEIMGGNGTNRVVEFLQNENEKISGCVLCESCAPEEMAGRYIKIGCRGSLNVNFISRGQQCHVVNGKNCGNHIHRFIAFLNALVEKKLDNGNEIFPASRMEITSIDIDNNIRNIIPDLATAKLNIRFNDFWNFATLERFIGDNAPSNVQIFFERFEESTICSEQKFIDFISDSITQTTNNKPKVGADGGNSDAIFIRKLTDVVEVGTPVIGAHVVDEFITESDLTILYQVYLNIMIDFEKYC